MCRNNCFLQNVAAIDKELAKLGFYCPLCYVEQMEGHKWHYWYFGRVPRIGLLPRRQRPPLEEAEASSRGGRAAAAAAATVASAAMV